VTNGSDMSVTIDVHHHILPDFFWRETNDSAHPVGGIAPPVWDKASARDAGLARRPSSGWMILD
jgi:hypothetical protein